MDKHDEEKYPQSSILFASSRDSCDIDAAGSRGANKTFRILGESGSPQRPAITRIKNRTEGDGEIDASTISRIIGSQEDRGVNAELRMRNKRHFMNDIKVVPHNYKNN